MNITIMWVSRGCSIFQQQPTGLPIGNVWKSSPGCPRTDPPPASLVKELFSVFCVKELFSVFCLFILGS